MIHRLFGDFNGRFWQQVRSINEASDKTTLWQIGTFIDQSKTVS